MGKWIKRMLYALVGPYVERQIEKEVDLGDFQTALRHSTYLCQKQEKAIKLQYFRALALTGLERFTESLAVANRVSQLIDDGVIEISDELSAEWLTVFAHVKCRALYGLNEYHQLHRFSSACNDRYSGVIPLQCYQLAAAIMLGTTRRETACLQRLENSLDRFNEAWYFLILYSAYKCLGHEEQADRIARLGLSKFPDHRGVLQMRAGNEVNTQLISPCTPSSEVTRCRRDSAH